MFFMANDSKTISIRFSTEEYYRILTECETRSITKTEWLERQIGLANKFKTSKNILLDFINALEVEFKDELDLQHKMKLNSIRRGIKDL